MPWYLSTIVGWLTPTTSHVVLQSWKAATEQGVPRLTIGDTYAQRQPPPLAPRSGENILVKKGW